MAPRAQFSFLLSKATVHLRGSTKQGAAKGLFPFKPHPAQPFPKVAAFHPTYQKKVNGPNTQLKPAKKSIYGPHPTEWLHSFRANPLSLPGLRAQCLTLTNDTSGDILGLGEPSNPGARHIGKSQREPFGGHRYDPKRNGNRLQLELENGWDWRFQTFSIGAPHQRLAQTSCCGSLPTSDGFGAKAHDL